MHYCNTLTKNHNKISPTRNTASNRTCTLCVKVRRLGACIHQWNIMWTMVAHILLYRACYYSLSKTVATLRNWFAKFCTVYIFISIRESKLIFSTGHYNLETSSVTCYIRLVMVNWLISTCTKGRHFAHDIFSCIFMNENICILNKVSLKFVCEDPIDNNPALA